jgi:outer membrane protein assembly factor BamD
MQAVFATIPAKSGLPLRRWILVMLLSVALAGCGGNDEQQDFQGSVTEAYEKAQSSMDNGNFRRAIQIYEQLQARFPFSEFATQIQLELMYAYYKASAPEQAIDIADTFLRENPTHARADYALYIKALANFDDSAGFLERVFRKEITNRPPRDAELAFSLFSRLVERYPASPYAADSQQRMIFLRNRLAAYQNSVARHYLKVGAYVAALNRAKTALEEYNGSDSGQESLELMVIAYEGLGMMDLAADTERVLQSNFPGS